VPILSNWLLCLTEPTIRFVENYSLQRLLLIHILAFQGKPKKVGAQQNASMNSRRSFAQFCSGKVSANEGSFQVPKGYDMLTAVYMKQEVCSKKKKM
jgi:hypothetical protein